MLVERAASALVSASARNQSRHAREPGNLGRHQNLLGVVADMSDSQVARMKKRCVDVLGSSGVYDRDLRQLCLLIARR